MMIAALLATSALAAPKGWNPSFARQMLDKQMNSTGYPFNPQFSTVTERPTQIVGGEVIDPPHQFPFLISMQRNWPSSPGPFCGASLVAPNWALTAAHCTEGTTPTPGPLTLLINWDDYTVTNPTVGEVRQVSAIHDHPDYGPGTLENDVSLLYFDEPVTTVRPVRLDDGTYSEPGQVGPVMGWGRTNNGAPTNWPERPHMVDVPIWTNFRCNEPSSYPGSVTDDMVCAGETGECSCNGDSGGPMVTPLAEDDVITGVVSWGDGVCGRADRPGVYARVSYFKSWIESFILDSIKENSTKAY